MTYYTMDELAARFKVKRITIKRWIAKRGFPQGVLPGEVKPVSATSRQGVDYTRHHNCRVLYLMSEVHDWEAALPREPIPVLDGQEDEDD